MTEDHSERKILRFFSNPIVGIVGSMASIIGLMLAIYFFMLSQRYRDLVYYVNPAKAVVVKTGQTSRLKIFIDDKEISSDVTAAQIAIWNQGKEPIRAGEILKKMTIQTIPSIPILEASIRKVSRDIIGLYIDQTLINEGSLTVSWNILEKDDGGVIQIVYAGGPEIEIKASGVIEGQAKIHELQYGDQQSLKLPRQKLQIKELLIMSLIFIGISIIPILFRNKLGRFIDSRFFVLLGACGIISAIVTFIMGWYLTPPAPPFGF